MRILMILDPLTALDPKMDTSLCLLRELVRRGHSLWTADVPDLASETRDVQVLARPAEVLAAAHAPREDAAASGKPAAALYPEDEIRLKSPERLSCASFNLILLRKEPPFNESYLFMTYALERLTGRVALSNDPRGIRDANEKMVCLHFPDWIPETKVTLSVAEILDFQSSLKTDLVIKPLDERGGRGVFRIARQDPEAERKLKEATRRETRPVVAQRFLEKNGPLPDKRILLLDGAILTAYEKRPPRNDFRANLCVGATYHPTEITETDRRLAADLAPFLRKRGLSFAGIDVMDGKLIEINVTCPAGICEAKTLYPSLPLVEKWADYLEGLPRA